MRVTLVEPNVLDDSSRYIVTATIAHRSPVSATADLDLYVTVTDGLFVVGYLILVGIRRGTFCGRVKDAAHKFLIIQGGFTSNIQDKPSIHHCIQCK